MIVIKKITVVAGGGHGGAWKVAFADFMTAMMAFFLVMWLLATASEPSKKAISDYFSTPSVIEYQFNNYGVELTLEKLFLDLINEPLKVFQSFVTPVDRTPNVMAMGMKKVVMQFMADQLGDIAQNVSVNAENVVFEIPDSVLFEKGTANPNSQFVGVMEKVKGVTTGLEDVDVVLTSIVYKQSTPGDSAKTAKAVAEQRLDLIQEKVKSSLENPTVDVTGKAFAGDATKRTAKTGPKDKTAPGGYLKLEIKQKMILPDGKKPRKLVNGVFGEKDETKDVYDNFVNQLSKAKRKEREPRAQ
jgi:chemotaxis protein MotB